MMVRGKGKGGFCVSGLGRVWVVESFLCGHGQGTLCLDDARLSLPSEFLSTDRFDAYFVCYRDQSENGAVSESSRECCMI